MFTNEQLMKLCKMYEEKLIELMGKKKYYKFSTECAKSLFIDDVCSMENNGFKQFILDNFDEITDLSDYENEDGII